MARCVGLRPTEHRAPCFIAIYPAQRERHAQRQRDREGQEAPQQTNTSIIYTYTYTYTCVSAQASASDTILWHASHQVLELGSHDFIRDELLQFGLGQRHQRHPIVVVQSFEWFNQGTYACLRVVMLIHFCAMCFA